MEIRSPSKDVSKQGKWGSFVFGVTDTEIKARSLGNESVDGHLLQADLGVVADPVSDLLRWPLLTWGLTLTHQRQGHRSPS